MSKCVRSLRDGVIDRHEDDQAATKVATGRYEYCSKSEWKSFKQKKEQANGKS